MSAREAILARLRARLGGADPTRQHAVEARLAAASPNLVPARGQLGEGERIDLFCAMAEEVDATTARIDTARDIPSAVADYLRSHNLPGCVRHGGDDLWAGLDWAGGAPGLALAQGPARPDDEIGLSHAFAAVAETGTLVLLSGPDNPTTLNFLPETHIVAVAAADVVGDYESVWKRLRKRLGKGVMPRTVNMITGPSRTADIAQKLELGAHGPRRLHIVVYDRA